MFDKKNGMLIVKNAKNPTMAATILTLNNKVICN
jgi:hypothetical protein